MRRSIAKNSFFNIIYNVANLIFPLIISMYAARVLLPEGVGKVSYAQSIASYFVSLASLALPSYAVREISKIRESQNDKNRIFSQLIFINLATSTIFTIVYMILIGCVGSFRSELVLCLLVGLPIILNFMNVDWLYQAEEQYSFIAVRGVLMKVLSLVMVFVLVKDQSDYIWYAFISSFATVGNYVLNMLHMRKFVTPKFNRANLNPSSLKVHFAPLAILAVSVFLSTLYSKTDTTMLGIMTTDRAVGLYTNAHKPAEIIITLCTSISAVFLPRLSYYYHNDQKEFEKLLSKGFQVLSFVTIPAAAGVFLLAQNAVTLLFGSAFAEAGITLRAFSMLIVIKSFGNLFCYQLVIATGNEKKRLPSYTMAAIANVVLNALLIPVWAQNGAVMASIVSELIVNGYQLIQMKKIVNMKVDWKYMGQAVLSSAVMVAAVYGFVTFVDMGVLSETAIAVLIGVTIYAVCNILMKNDTAMMVLNKVSMRMKRT